MSNILDLDIFKSIKHLDITIDIKFIDSLIWKLVKMVKKFGKYNGIIYCDTGTIIQYVLPIKYLKNTLEIKLEYDNNYQFINIIYYNQDQTKNYLKLFLSIKDEPTIKYIENDHSSYLPFYVDDKVTLKPGGYLMNFAHRLFSYIGFTRVRLDDDSCLITKNENGDEIKTKLWLYYSLKNGKSWYAKFGYCSASCNIIEYNMIIKDVRNIKLNDISSCLKKLLDAPNRRYLDSSLVMTSDILLNLIDKTTETLYEYTLNHTLEDFTTLTNNLTQSMYSKNVSIEIESENDKHNSTNIECYTLSFPWFHIIKKLFIANAMQVNNNIGEYFYKL